MGTNRLTGPIVARTLSGAALSPCSDAGGNQRESGAGHAGATGTKDTPLSDVPAVAIWSVAPLDAPSDVSLVGLRRALRGLSASVNPAVQFLVDLTDFERPDPRYRPAPVELCGWLDDLRQVADEIASHATVIHHACDLLWGRCSSELTDRREAEQELATGGQPMKTPMRCRFCGGSGVVGRDEFGNWDGCDRCENTGIDPDDPAFPL